MDPQTNSPFFALPAELRNTIYILTFAETIIEVPNPRQLKLAGPGILLSCNQAYTEALEYFYEHTAFRFAVFADAKYWATYQLSKTFASLIKKIVIRRALVRERCLANEDDQTIKRIYNQFYTECFISMMSRRGLDFKDIELVVEQVEKVSVQR